MNLTYKWGFYIDNKLVLIDAQLNLDLDYYKQLKDLLRVEKLKDYLLVRVGNENNYDGSYLMAKSFKKKQIVYSFSMGNNLELENSLLEKGCEVNFYNPTIESLPFEREGFNFFNQGVAGNSSDDVKIESLEGFIKANGHNGKTGMILKMDIEGAEWDFLDSVQTKTLNQFDQIVFEFHNLVRACNKLEMEKRLNSLRKLNKTHKLVHLHGNNTGYVLQMNGHTIPDVIEVTYVNKERYDTFEPRVLTLPTPDDFPCDKNREDINLSTWNIPFDEDPFAVNF